MPSLMSAQEYSTFGNIITGFRTTKAQAGADAGGNRTVHEYS